MSVVSYKCPNCGGGLSFNPATQAFDCEYCLSRFTQPELDEYYKDWDKSLDDQNNVDPEPVPVQADADDDNFDAHAVCYICPSCGAEVITSDTTAATECYYCQNPVVLSGRLSGEFKPEKVIPFVLSRDEAIKRFEELCKKKKYLPSGFFSKKHFEKVSGVYFPYYLVDTHVDGCANATGNIVRTWRVGDTRYTETKKYQLVRQGDITFNGIPSPALKKEDQLMLEYVHPFDPSKLVDFSMPYLSGFKAEKRDVGPDDLKESVNKKIDEYARLTYKDTMSQYSSVNITNLDLTSLTEEWKYTLLPVWILTYKFEGKILVYAMNGQSGKIYGDLPVDKKKLFWWSAIYALIAFIIVFLIGGLL
ncbi:MAG: TFIIB-type zinc ribbon-containing protein [Acutalibacteraceae bacterium]